MGQMEEKIKEAATEQMTEQAAESITDKLYMKKMELREVKEITDQYDYIIAHMISNMEYGYPMEVQINWDELVELRAFNETEEIHVFEHESDSLGEPRAVRIFEKDGGGDYLVKSYRMRNGKILKIKEYLAADEDGQAVVICTRPFAVTEEA